ncbi:MAG TPA: type I-U CRISPR-associated protein Cas5/Cas6 [Planctomycetaceae bacterium]|nr:type I-U CRISPR-associated protein Cas5/Cas6 [Planctomycetaceae bacterium]
MTRYLCISVTFLDPFFHGKGDSDAEHPAGRPEWPPSPMRLFQALLAGSRTGCRNREWSPAKAAAFRWLECQGAPLIVAPVARLASAVTLFVPNNDGDKKFDRQERLTSKLVYPHRLCGGDTVHYLWPIDEAAHSHAVLLAGEARHLLSLGWGIDQVVGNGRILDEAQAAELRGQGMCWRPWTHYRLGQQQRRIPVKGSLSDLERVHKSFLGRVNRMQYRRPIKVTRFDTVTYMSVCTMPWRSYAVFELPEGVAFRQVDVVKVAAMLRSLTCREHNRRDFQEQFPEIDPEVYLAGHVNRTEQTPPRFSYLPLPTIGHEHADGMIRRLLIAEPYGGDGSCARWAQNRLRNQTLRDIDGNECGELLDLWRSGSEAMIQRYVGEGEVWSTVTPVILPGFDDGKHTKAEKLFLTAVKQAGLPLEAFAELALRKAPFWPRSQHPRSYHRPDYLKSLPAWHAWIRFREAICGPVAIGAGRHCGLGVFAAEESRK